MTRVSDRTFQSRQESTFSADSLCLTVFVQLSILRCSCSSLSYCVRTAFRFTVFVQLCLTVFVQLFLTVFVQLSVLRCSYKSLHVLRCSYKSLSYGVRTVLCVIVFVQPRVQSSASAFVRTFTIPSTVWPHENPAHTDRNGWCCSLKPLYLTVPR